MENQDRNQDVFVIDGLKIFLETTRVWVYGLFGGTEVGDILDLRYKNLDSEEKEELDTYLTLKEVTTIAVSYIRFDKTNKQYIISLSDYESFVEALNSRLISNIMNGLVAKGQLECAFDDEKQDFIFWRKEDGKKNI